MQRDHNLEAQLRAEYERREALSLAPEGNRRERRAMESVERRQLAKRAAERAVDRAARPVFVSSVGASGVIHV